ncbi:hypothetical protein L7F22_054519 [Adiantum nelumboides]|nr:hypothetical protein [Adiantum nelumboides]
MGANFGKGGMKKLVDDMAASHAISAVEAAAYGLKVEPQMNKESKSFEGAYEEIGDLWPNAMELVAKGKLTKETLHEAGDCIRMETGPSQEPSLQVPSPPEVPMEETSTGKKKDTGKAKGKSPTYKLQSDIEAATNLEKVLEERILNSKVEFTLGEVLGIAKREFHEEIIDIIKRKRQTLTESIHSQGEE